MSQPDQSPHTPYEPWPADRPTSPLANRPLNPSEPVPVLHRQRSLFMTAFRRHLGSVLTALLVFDVVLAVVAGLALLVLRAGS